VCDRRMMLPSYRAINISLVCSLGIVGVFVLLGRDRIQHVETTRSLFGGQKGSKAPVTNILDGCYHVYLDVGSNIGVQVRKLYQPEHFPGAGIINEFRLAFGGDVKHDLKDDFNDICVVGFEPNPRHTPGLLEIQEEYTKCGWSVRFHTETAVSNYNGKTDFYTDSKPYNNEMGAGIVGENVNLKGKSATVDVLRLSDFVLNVVAQRRLPEQEKGKKAPTVLMKMDIEGSEVDVLPDLMWSGAISHIDTALIEFHERLSKDQFRKDLSSSLKQVMKAMAPKFVYKGADDESYFKGEKKPFPQCKA